MNKSKIKLKQNLSVPPMRTVQKRLVPTFTRISATNLLTLSRFNKISHLIPQKQQMANLVTVCNDEEHGYCVSSKAVYRKICTSDAYLRYNTV